MTRLTTLVATTACVVIGSMSIGGRDAPTAAAATQIDVDSTAPTGGDCALPDQCTLGAAITLAATVGDVSVALPAGTFEVPSALTVPTNGVEIRGAGPSTIIEGTGADRLFEATGGSLTFVDVTLRNGFAEQGGAGAIFATDTAVTLVSVVVEDNGATGDGGAIGLVGGALVVADSTFVRNYGQNGGAVFTADAAVTITGSTFSDNGASQSGGAAFVSFPPSFSVRSSAFTANTAIKDGGGFAIEGVGDNGTVGVVDDVDFDANTAAGLGGAVFVRTSPVYSSVGLTVTDSSFTGNSADAGGALALSDPPVAVSNSSFRANSAQGSGGAIVSNTVLTVTSVMFEANTSGESGGAIASSGVLSVAGSDFVTNQASGSGGAFLLIGELPTIAGTFSGNSADGLGNVALWTGRSALLIAGVPSADIAAPLVPAQTAGPTTTTPLVPPTTPGGGTAAAAVPNVETTIPPTTVPSGVIGVQPAVEGPASSGTTPPLGGSLPTTGSGIGPVLKLGALAIVVGIGLLIVRRTRSRRTAGT